MARDQIKQAVAYLRANDGSAAKLEAQRQRIAAWAAKTETEIGSWHLEGGSWTVKMRHRPERLRALAAIELGGAQVLVVARSEALTRGARQMVALVEWVGRLGAEVQSAVEGSLTAESGRFLLTPRQVSMLSARRVW